MSEPAQDIVAGTARTLPSGPGKPAAAASPAASPSSSPSWQAFALTALRAGTRPHDHQRRSLLILAQIHPRHRPVPADHGTQRGDPVRSGPPASPRSPWRHGRPPASLGF